MVDIDDYVHVIDGTVVCYEPDVFDLTDEKQVELLFDIANNTLDNDFDRQRNRTVRNTRIVASPYSDNERTISLLNMFDLPAEYLKKIEVIWNAN